MREDKRAWRREHGAGSVAQRAGSLAQGTWRRGQGTWRKGQGACPFHFTKQSTFIIFINQN